MSNGDDTTMLKRTRVGDTWFNWHQTVSGPIAAVDVVFYPPDEEAYGANVIKRCTRQIQRSIAEAKRQGVEHRAVGRGWSLSEAPLTTGVMLDLSDLTGKKLIHHTQVDPQYSGGAVRRRGLCLVQAGNYVSELNRWLEHASQGLSLCTSGAANGQTIIGATQTGTHGSVLDFAAMHDQIVGIHLLAGETNQYWLERASYPVLRDAVPQSFGATPLRDDDLFNAVVMGLGAFGVIHNVVIEARPRLLLEAHNYNKDGNEAALILDAAMRRRIGSLDFTSDPHLDPPGSAGRPYSFQPIVNPHTDPPEVLVTQMYERPWDASHVPDYTTGESSFGPGYDFLSAVGLALDLFQFLVQLFSRLVANELFVLGTSTRSWGELFGYKAMRTKVASGTVAVPLERALDTLDLLIALNKNIGPVPLVYGCRYVKKSAALLAFNRWDTTFVISIDGVWNTSSLRFLDRIPSAMEAANIPFSQHWGKTNGYTKARIQNLYRQNFTRWRAARAVLLPDPADRALFSNRYLRERGLTH